MAKSAEYWKKVRRDNIRKWRAENPEEYRRRAREHARLRRARATPEQKRAWAEASRVWRQNNLERCKKRDRAYAERNRERFREGRRLYQREFLRRRRENPEYRALEALRARLRESFGKKYMTGRSAVLFGEGYWTEIVKLLKDGMTVDNYGHVWHIDHVIPVSWFDIKSPEHRAVCFHWSNLRPEFARANRSRSNSCTEADFAFVLSRCPEKHVKVIREVWERGHPKLREEQVRNLSDES